MISLFKKKYYITLLFIFAFGLTYKFLISQTNLVSNSNVPSFISLTNSLSSLASLSEKAKEFMKPKNFFADFINKLIDKKIDLKVPKIIHYIWLGGPIYREYWLTITKMATIARANGYKVWVWVDNSRNLKRLKTKPNSEIGISNAKRVLRNNDTYDHYINKIKSIEIKSIYDFEKQTKELKDLPHNFYNNFWRSVKDEMVGLKNYGAASDLLRYFILYIYGGLYFDTDEIIHSFGLKIPNIGTLILPYGFKNNLIANSILVSIKGHPLLMYILLSSLNALNTLNFEEKGIKRQYGGSPYRSRKGFTIDTTGPPLLVYCRKEFAEQLASRLSDEAYRIDEDLQLDTARRSDFEKLGHSEVSPKLFAVKIGENLIVETRSDQTWLQGKNPKFVEE